MNHYAVVIILSSGSRLTQFAFAEDAEKAKELARNRHEGCRIQDVELVGEASQINSPCLDDLEVTVAPYHPNGRE